MAHFDPLNPCPERYPTAAETLPPDSDDRLAEAIASFEEARDAGSSPDPQNWLTRYPEVAIRLADFFAGQQCLRQLAGPLAAPGDAAFKDRYEVRCQLWLDGPHGGHLAFDRVLGRKVVLNTPYRARDIERFVKGAETRARVRHANLIPIYDMGLTDERVPFFTEPFFDATRLGCLLRDNTLDVTLQTLAVYVLTVCKALHALHNEGLLHLDLCPMEILVATESDDVFLTGGHLVPKEAVPSPDEPESFIIGRAGYKAPEQLDPANLGSVGVAADVYGLGGVLHEILFWEPPNRGESRRPIEIMQSTLARKAPPKRGEPSRYASHSPILAGRLESICFRALEFDPKSRYQEMGSFATAIEKVVYQYTR
jgi:serine/threonine protein kinase